MFSEDFKRTLEGAKAAYFARSDQWTASTAEVADHFLNVLPPIYGPGCFACSEPYTHDAAGQGIYLTFRKTDYDRNTSEARYCTVAQIKGATK